MNADLNAAINIAARAVINRPIVAAVAASYKLTNSFVGGMAGQLGN